MAVKIRLQRKGRKKKPFYHIVAADARAPRDGKFIEKIGTYNPLTVPATIELNNDVALNWLDKGAQPTDTARAILKFKGVYFKKHLQRGVAKGAFSQEEADKQYQEWIGAKEANVEKRKEATKNAMEERRKKIFGVPPAKPAAVEAAAPAEANDEAATEDNAEA
jgi:small subunit ribosomal protein S16